MSSHDCSLEGSLVLKEGVTLEEVRVALEPFLDVDGPGRSTFEELLAEHDLSLDGQDLTLSVDFWGYGGYQNDDVDALRDRLAQLVAKPGALELLDHDEPDADCACVPVLVSPDDAGAQEARLEYGISLAADQLTAVLGQAEFDKLAAHIRALPRLPVVTQ